MILIIFFVCFEIFNDTVLLLKLLYFIDIIFNLQLFAFLPTKKIEKNSVKSKISIINKKIVIHDNPSFFWNKLKENRCKQIISKNIFLCLVGRLIII